MNIQAVIEKLEKKRYTVKCFNSAEDAADYIDSQIDSRTVGFGDSETMKNMHLYERLSAHNTVYDPAQSNDDDEFIEIAKKTLLTDVFLTSVNGMSETGEMVNIDGAGNRVAGSIFGHEKIYFIIGTNKIEPSLEKAIYRARNTAGPKNAKRYKLNTPCAIKGDKCYDCSSPDRICNSLNIYLNKMENIDTEIVLINQKLGF